MRGNQSIFRIEITLVMNRIETNELFKVVELEIQELPIFFPLQYACSSIITVSFTG